MDYILFTCYLAIACFLVTRISFIKRTGLSAGFILLLFLLKISAGLLIGWMSQKYYPQGNDYWGLNVAGVEEFNIIKSNPGTFFRDLFNSRYQHGYAGFFDSTGSFWNDLKNTLIIKFLALCNIFSHGNYYINSLFCNFIGFFGHVALFRIFIDIYHDKKWPVIAGCFLLPSTLYFTAGIHKDLFVFSMLGLYCYSLFSMVTNRVRLKYIIVLAITFTGLLLIRNFVAIAIIPASIAFVITVKRKWNGILVFASVYISGFLLLALLETITPSFQPLKVITKKQKDFFDLPYASSQIDTYVLQPNLKSLVKNTPQALDHSLLRPYLWESPTKFLVPLAIELFLYELLFIMMLIFFRRDNPAGHGFIIFGITISLSMLLFTGLIVPNEGSIVRYRSIYLPLLMTPVLCAINWQKLFPRKHIIS